MATPFDIHVPQQSVEVYPTIITSSSQIVTPNPTSQIIIPSSQSQILIPTSPSVGGITVNVRKTATSPSTSSRLVIPSKTASRQVIANIMKKPIESGSPSSRMSGNLLKATPRTPCTPSTSGTLSTPGSSSKPTISNKPNMSALKASARKPVVNPHVGKAIAEKKACLFQELSRVMRDTAAANRLASSKKSSTLSTNKEGVNAVGSPGLNQPETKQPSSEKTAAFKENSVSKTMLPKEAVVIPSTTGPSNTSLIIPSVITSDVLGQMSVPLMPIVSASGNNSVQSQPSTNLMVEPAVSQSNNFVGSKESNGLILHTGSTQPAIMYAVSSSTPSGLSIPNSNQLYAIVQTPTTTTVEGVQPTIYGNILPSANSIPVAHVQNTQQVSMSGIQPTNVLNAGSGAMLFAIVGNQGVVTAPSMPLTVGNSVPMIVEGSTTSVSKSDLVNKASELKQSQSIYQPVVPEKDIPIDNQPSVESSLIHEAGNASEIMSGGLFSEPIEETELTVEKPTEVKKTENDQLSIKSIKPPVIKKSDTEVKKPDNITPLRRPQEKRSVEKKRSEKQRSDHERMKTQKGSPKKLSAVDVVKNQMKRIENFYKALPPRKSYISISPGDCQKLSDFMEETTQHMRNIYKDIKSFNDARSSSVSAAKSDTDRGQILCRLCAGFFKREALIPLYKIGSDQSNLVMMINFVVPESMRVQALDGLPQDICKDCSDKLTGCYDMIHGFLEADKRLREILGLQAKTPREELPKKQRVREEMRTGKLTTYTPSPQCRKRCRDSSPDGMTSDSETLQQRKRRQVDSSSDQLPSNSIDYSRLDPEYDVGFEVEWCLDEETIRSTLDTTSEEKETEGAVGPSESDVRMDDDSNVVEEEEASLKNAQEEHTEHSVNKLTEHTGDNLTECTEDEHPVVAAADLEVSGDTSSDPHVLSTLPCSDSSMVDNIPETPSHAEPSLPSDKESDSHTIPVDENAAVEQKEEGELGDKQPDEHQAEVSGSTQNSFECDQCELTFLNEYSYFIHKSVVHDNIMDSKSLSKYKTELQERKRLETGNISVKSKKKQRRRTTTDSKVLYSDGKFFKCGSGMLWVDSSRLENKSEMFDSKCKEKYQKRVHFNREAGISSAVVICDEKSSLQYDFLHQYVKEEYISPDEIQGQDTEHKCKQCDSVFLTIDSLNNHIPSHLSPDCLCDECGVVMTSENKLKQHKKEHTQSLPHNCEVCGKGFPNEQTIKVHRAIHFSKRGPYMCQFCKKSFYFRINFERHRASHTSRKPLKCSVCFRTFKSRMLLHKHLALHRLTKCFDCCVCHKLFASWNGLIKHRYQNHLGTDIAYAKKQLDTKEVLPFYQCSICRKVLESKRSLIRHLSSHKSNWPFHCFLCSRNYASRDFLNQHECYSRKTVGYQCTFCGNSFLKKKALKIHKVLHNNNRQHVCLYCGRAFRFYQSLFSHILMHAGKDAKCPRCHQWFESKGALWKHHGLKCKRIQS